MTQPHHPSLQRPAADLIGGEWILLDPPPANPDGAGSVTSWNPAHPGEPIWSASTRGEHPDRAIAAARAALPTWIHAGRDRRFAVLRRYQEICRARERQIAELIRDEVGKVMWEARAEAVALAGKVDITLDQSPTSGLARTTDWEIPLAPSRTGRTLFRPHGVMAVIGPFNFPAHLPNGHIVPALAMGNTIILKPSDKAPAVGQLIGELFQEALHQEGFPDGVVNVVQGGADIAAAIVQHDGIDGILFTGSWPVGRRILQASLDRPGRIAALEMGGNNAAVVLPDADLRQAAIEIVRSAFNTAGQRCTCTRRAVLHRDIAPAMIAAICKAATQLIIGDPRAEYPMFMGPVISSHARDGILGAVAEFSKSGGEVLVEGSQVEVQGARGWFVSPSVVRVDRFLPSDGSDAGCDVEVFGPVLRICIVDSLDAAIAQANATRFGLAASIFTTNQASAERFLAEARAGCINVNTGTAGASSKLPFGGLGLSGNHRPAGSFSLDYCAYPVAAMVESGSAATIPEGMRFDDAWLG
ncbi:MAG: aldehyde dehydrogenase family protein [Phycisphaeraceae bacterium]|nr:aldehyde dehydrogenase family protein [Phycisphaeraceae bacterium]